MPSPRQVRPAPPLPLALEGLESRTLLASDDLIGVFLPPIDVSGGEASANFPGPDHGGDGGRVVIRAGLPVNAGKGRQPLRESRVLTGGTHEFLEVKAPGSNLVLTIRGKVTLRVRYTFNPARIIGEFGPDGSAPELRVYAGESLYQGQDPDFVDFKSGHLLQTELVDFSPDAPGPGGRALNGGVFEFHTSEPGVRGGQYEYLLAHGGNAYDGGDGGDGGLIDVQTTGDMHVLTAGAAGGHAEGRYTSERRRDGSSTGGKGGDGGTVVVAAHGSHVGSVSASAPGGQGGVAASAAGARGGDGGAGGRVAIVAVGTKPFGINSPDAPVRVQAPGGDGGDGARFDHQYSPSPAGGDGGDGGAGGAVNSSLPLRQNAATSSTQPFFQIDGGKGGNGGKGNPAGTGGDGGARGSARNVSGLKAVGGAGGRGGSGADGYRDISGVVPPGEGGDGGDAGSPEAAAGPAGLGGVDADFQDRAASGTAGGIGAPTPPSIPPLPPALSPGGTTVPALTLREVSFGGEGYREILPDDGGDGYGLPHWRDLNGDGKPHAGSEREYPVLYAAESRIVAGAAWAAAGGETAKLTARARSGGKTVLPKTPLRRDRDLYVLPATTFGEALARRVQARRLRLEWQVSADGGRTWVAAGVSTNQLYVSAMPPDPKTTLYHTTVHLAVTGAEGVSAGNENAITKSVFKKFAGLKITPIGSRETLKYWVDERTTGATTADLLKNRKGRCEAWAQFLVDTLRVHGIVANMIVVKPTKEGHVIMVEEWDLPTRQRSYTSLSNTDPTDVFLGVINRPGVPAQGLKEPGKAIFANHAVVQVGRRYYDPSYGQIYTNEQHMEEKVIAGYAIKEKSLVGTNWTIMRANARGAPDLNFVVGRY